MKKLAIIFGAVLLISIAFISAHYNSERDLDKNGKVSFNEWMKGLWGKITGKVLLQACGDGDGDSYKSGDGCTERILDCNDLNAQIYPGAPENTNALCSDGKDNDCDFVTDCADSDCSGSSLCQVQVQCSDGCLTNGAKQCSGNGYQTCGNYDSDSCLEWSSVTSCSSSETCVQGVCVSSPGVCTDTDIPGKNFTVSGSAFNISNTAQDSCINGTALNESFCSGNNINFEVFNCKTLTGYNSCAGGACSCFSNYTLNLISCDLQEDIINLTDISGCGAPDILKAYDCNSNGVISKPSCISTTADVFIDFLPFNDSINYTNAGAQIVQIAEGYQGAEFGWDFSASEKLDFCEIDIKTSSPTDKFGYVLFNSSEEISNKTIYVDKLNSSSNAVCIKDVSGVSSVSEFSANCSASNEVLVKCPSSANSTYNCEIIENGTTFQVWPLNHSAVKEMLSITGLVSGGTGNFSNFTNLTNQTETGETEKCIPDWTCANFGKCADGFKERVCADLNNCGVEINKPSETSECKTKSTLFIILGIVGLILIIFLIIYFMKRGKSGEEPSEENQFTRQTPPPSPPQNRIVQHKPQYNQLAPQR